MPEQPLTFASFGVAGVHYARCEPCMYLQHPGGHHDWAGAEDVQHALATGQPDPTGLRCACHCYDEPARSEEPPDVDEVPMYVDPCSICGETGRERVRRSAVAPPPTPGDDDPDDCPDCGGSWGERFCTPAPATGGLRERIEALPTYQIGLDLIHGRVVREVDLRAALAATGQPETADRPAQVPPLGGES